MTVALVLIGLTVGAVVAHALYRAAAPPPERPSPANRTRPAAANRRFKGRVIESATAAVGEDPGARRKLSDGTRISAVRNGRVHIPADAIGLGCLAPISECTRGADCICKSQRPVARDGVHL